MSTFFNRFQLLKKDLSGFFRSMDFSKGLMLGLAIIIPIVIGVYFEFFEIGLAVALGALLSSPSNVNGSFRNRNFGILLSTLLAVLASFIGGFLAFEIWVLVPVLGLLMFGISYLAVFGFRASLISFSGLFALVLSFANISNVLEIYERAFFIGIGGLWYLTLTLLYHRLYPRAETQLFLADSLRITGEYLEIRAVLLTAVGNREELLKKLLQLQAELNEKHETLRDILISSRASSGNSTFQQKQLLILIQLVDMLELAMANPVDYKKMDQLLSHSKAPVPEFRKLISSMALRLKSIAEAVQNDEKISSDRKLSENFEVVKSDLAAYSVEKKETDTEAFLMLQNLLDYQQKQLEKIRKIEVLLGSNVLPETSIIPDEISRFRSRQDYDLKVLRENFTLNSVIFKHSLRLALVVMLGYVIGAYLEVQNAYWILLTIVVIMRPGYGLTKDRSKQRLFGTLIGAAIATAIVLLIQNAVVYSVLGIVCLILAFSLVQKNYRTSAIFVTLSVVFVYALLKPDVLNVIQYRVLDTLIGAGLATVGNLLLWPSWEYLSIRTVIRESVAANRDFLKEISDFYVKKGKLPTSYKLARKKVFLATGELNAAFQRMAQEPGSRQVNLDRIYELVVLNHSFLSSLASMGTYIRSHKTTPASGAFLSYEKLIEENLDLAVTALQDKDLIIEPLDVQNKETGLALEQKYRELTRTEDEETGIEQLQEAQLMIGQLKWLLELSEKIKKALETTEFS